MLKSIFSVSEKEPAPAPAGWQFFGNLLSVDSECPADPAPPLCGVEPAVWSSAPLKFGKFAFCPSAGFELKFDGRVLFFED